MAHQVNFYTVPEDIAKIEAEVRRIEKMTILKSRSPTKKPYAVCSLDVMENEQPWLFFHIVREEDINLVVTRHVPAQGYWTIDVLRSPVIEFNKCYFDGNILRRGRVYYVDGYYGSDDTWIEKPKRFRLWAKSVLKTTRKCLMKHRSEYVGQETLRWLENSRGKLVQ